MTSGTVADMSACDFEALATAFAGLAASGVNEANVARWFGVPLISDIRHVRSTARPSARQGPGAWIALLVGGESMVDTALRAPASCLDALRAHGLVGDTDAGRGMQRANFAFVPVGGVWVVADRFDAIDNAERGVDTVMPPDLSALQLVHALPRFDDGSAMLDIGCGSGALALTAARRGARVRASDVDPRALELGKLGARINRVEIEWVHASLLDRAPREQALVVFNSPLCRAPLAGADPAEETSYYRAPKGELDGTALALRFIRLLPDHMMSPPAGEALMQVQLVPEVLAELNELSARRAVLCVLFADAPDGTPHALVWIRAGAGLRRLRVPLSPVCRHLERAQLEALARSGLRVAKPEPLGDDETCVPASWLELRQSRQLAVAGAIPWRDTRFGVTSIDDATLMLIERLDGKSLGELGVDRTDREHLRTLAERGLVILC